MTLSHIFRPKQRLQFRITYYAESARWRSSTASESETKDSPSSSKKGGPAFTREHKEKAIELYVKRYMQENPGIFPKPTYVHKEIGGSWYTLKDILQNLKVKIMSSLRSQNLSPIADSKDTQTPDKTKIDEDKIIVSPTVYDEPSGNATNPPASKIITEYSKSENLLQSSLEMVDSSEESKIIEKLIKENVRNDNGSYNPKPLEVNTKERGSEEPKGTIVNLDHDLISKNDQVSSSDSSKLLEFKDRRPKDPKGIKVNLESDRRPMFDQLYSKNSRDSFVNRLRDVGYGKQAESKLTTSSSNVNASPHMDSLSSLFGGTDKPNGLSNLFMKMNNGQRDVKSVDITKNQNTTNLQKLNEIKSTLCGYAPYGNKKSASSSGAQKIMSGLADDAKDITKNQNTTNLQKLNEIKSTLCGYAPYGNKQSASSSGAQKIMSGLADDAKDNQEEVQGIEANETLTPFSQEGDSKSFELKSLIDCVKELPTGQSLVRPEDEIVPKTISNKTHRSTHRNVLTGVQSQANTEDKNGSVSNAFDMSNFKTVEGTKNTLQKRHTIIQDIVADEEASTTNKLTIPNLIGDPDVPSTLIRNPRLTVAIKPLTHYINSHHIEKALAFCETKISGFLYGPSRSVAYVEFETEEGKARALAEQSLLVLGKQLSILRIDAPRTTVVRLSSSSCVSLRVLKPILESCGKIQNIYQRHTSLVDVYFELEEWPNMLNILNRLNGIEVVGERLVVVPAPAFPPEILRVLWSHPEERRHVKAVLRSLIKKFGECSVNKVAVADIAARLYGDRW